MINKNQICKMLKITEISTISTITINILIFFNDFNRVIILHLFIFVYHV